ncbi:MAG: GNAT family N-acetyltransferase [Firmicutes bacterium]|nr:GNAT family N-acetyltransferase [Bacillota bacterium]
MPDMLVKLYELPSVDGLVRAFGDQGVILRRAIAPEKHPVVTWVYDTFGQGWSDECEVSFSRAPVSCFVAQGSEGMIGFACYDATAKAFFGPTGVREDQRNRGIGRALLLLSLYAMACDGYAYAIIGGAGPMAFYTKVVGATTIEGSMPGIYRNMLKNGPPS